MAFESWSRRETAVKAYKEKKQLNYTILVATDQTIKDYQTNGSAPWFFILDEQRVIQKAIRGYGLSLIHISEPTRLGMISYAVFCLKKKKKIKKKKYKKKKKR